MEAQEKREYYLIVKFAIKVKIIVRIGIKRNLMPEHDKHTFGGNIRFLFKSQKITEQIKIIKNISTTYLLFRNEILFNAKEARM